MVTIDKIKLIKKGEALAYSYSKLETDGRRAAVKEETGKYPCHPDLVAAFDALRPHVAFLGGYREWPKTWEKVKPEDFEKFVCTSFSLSGEDNEAVVLTAHHLRWDGKAVGYNCPLENLHESDEAPASGQTKRYPFLECLREDLDHLDTEARHYMEGTKKGEVKDKATPATNPNQLTIEGEINKVTKAQIAQPLTPDEGKTFKENSGGSGMKIPQADPEAMKRVRDGFAEEATLISETKNKPAKGPADVAAAIVAEVNAGKAKETAAQKKKRVAQSASNPSGIVNDDNDLDANK